MTHSVEEVFLTRGDLFGLELVDYPGLDLSSISYPDLASGKTHEYKQSLRLSIEASGIRRPILLLARENARMRLVDGHHRAVMGLTEGIKVPASIHHCRCEPHLWDYFDLCPTIWTAYRDEQAEASRCAF